MASEVDHKPSWKARLHQRFEQMRAGGCHTSFCPSQCLGESTMIRKMFFYGGLTLLGTGLVFGREGFSYLHTFRHHVRQTVKHEVPLEFQIERARQMAESLIPDLHHSLHVIAEQQVEIETISERVTTREDELGKQKAVILSLNRDLGNGEKSTYKYASHTYTAEDVQKDLERRFKRFKAAEEELKRDRQILNAREAALAANREKLEGLMTAKGELDVQIAQLEARLKAVEAAESVSKLAIDNSRLSEVKRLISELNKDLDVKQKMLDAEGEFIDLIPSESILEPTPQDLSQQIDKYFGDEQPKSESKNEQTSLDVAHIE